MNFPLIEIATNNKLWRISTMKNVFRFFCLVIFGWLIVFAGCKKNDDSSDDTPAVVAPVVKPYLGKYVHTTNSGSALEFFDSGTVYWWVGSNHADGTYSMVTTTRVKVNIGTFGEGDFSGDFSTLTIAGSTYRK